MLVLAALIFAGFVALGVWQVHRRAWKLALIDHVTHRIHAAPVPAPGPAAWPTITADADAYRRVVVRGHYENGRETLVQANTELGPGFWVLTPFDTARGFTILVNRGFVPPEHRDPATRAEGQIAGETSVTGLLRVTEPRGTLLRHNDPQHGRWFSRDVTAIARAGGLGTVAPYFIDADKIVLPPNAPVGGLTVVHFRNAHLQYAITWFALALLTLIGIGLLIRYERRLRHGKPPNRPFSRR
ncbi:MAG TPA: SURF1 family protein [Sphingomonas sp.]|nr:SURF1 family protein [Sphingomonas sp.]